MSPAIEGELSLEESLRRLNNNDDDSITSLDVSLHSTNTEISEMTEQTILSQITTISKRNKELESVLAGLEQDQRDQIQGILESFQKNENKTPLDTCPKPQEPLLQVWAKSLGLAKDKAANTLQQAQLEQQLTQQQTHQQSPKNGLVQFFQDRVETFARNIETLTKALQPKNSLPQIQEEEEEQSSSYSCQDSLRKPNKDDDSTVLLAELEEDKKQRSIIVGLQESWRERDASTN